MTDTPTLFDEGPFELAEGPIWFGGMLYWVDITAGTVHRRGLGDAARQSVDLGQSVGCLMSGRGGELIAGLREGLATIEFPGGIANWLDRSFAADPDRRCNDGNTDPGGRVLIGTMLDSMQPGTGTLHRFDQRGMQTVRRNLTIPNGLVWSPDGRLMHHIDSPRRIVETLEYDPDTGDVGPVIRSMTTPPELGYPDGMCMDPGGCLWIAHWGGGCVTRWDPIEGRLMRKIELPAEHATSCCFGGVEGLDLFITTARSDRTGPGAVFSCRPL